ncbi:MAG TPA: YbaK/EbsC family protein [Anaerolineae bacterium]|nr:YbaK/EbsC family protein [Anaerolineae bacterium]
MTEKTRETLALYIEQHAIAATLLQPDQETPTVALAALALGCQTDQIVKSVLFLLRDGQQADPVLVITNGTSQIDFRKLADLFQLGRKRIRMAPSDVVLARTGYPAGGVPPFGFPQPLPTTIDRHVFDQAVVYGGGGDDRTMLRITPAELLRVTGGQVADVRQTTT